MGIRGREMIKKEFAVNEQIVGDLEIFKQRHFRKSAHAFRRIRRVTDVSRRKYPEEKRADSRSAPRHERQRLQLLPGVAGQQFCLREGARNPGLDRETFR